MRSLLTPIKYMTVKIGYESDMFSRYKCFIENKPI